MAISMEALTARLEETINRLNASEAELLRLRQDSAQMQEGTVGGMARLVEALDRQGQRAQSRTLVDSRGLGKPPNFRGQDGEWPMWARKFENYVGAVHRGADTVLEWASERRAQITPQELEESFGALAPDAERIGSLDEINSEVYVLLTQYMEGESFDIVMNCPGGAGLDAYHRLARRHDPATGGRRRNLLRAILQPGRSSLEGLSSALERWEEQVQRYERFRDEEGVRHLLEVDIKLAALEALVPVELERHLQLNASRLATYEASREEVRLYVETRCGLKVKDQRIIADGSKPRRGPDDMDVDSSVKGKGKAKGKGKGKDGKAKGKAKGKGKGKDSQQGKAPATSQFQGECHNCGKWGHRSSECWQKKNSHSSNGKGAGAVATQNERAKGTNSVENGNAEPETEQQVGAFDVCSVNTLDVNSFAARSQIEVSDRHGVWRRMNLDTGAAATVFPMSVPDKVTQDGLGGNYKTASGEIVSDEGAGIIHGIGEDGIPRRVRGRVAGVHKVLVSASQSCRVGNVIVLTKHGGSIIPERDDIAKAVMKLQTAASGKKGITPLYVENGVYNLYLKKGNSVSPEQDLAPMAEAEGVPPSGGNRQAKAP